MNAEIENILNEAKLLSDSLKAKGWSNAFMTNGAYPDGVKQSIEKYLLQSMLGYEKGICAGLTLSTYAKYENMGSDSVVCEFSVKLGAANSLRVTQMNIRHLNRYNKEISAKSVEVTDQSEILSKEQAIIQVIAPSVQKSTGRRRFKI